MLTLRTLKCILNKHASSRIIFRKHTTSIKYGFVTASLATTGLASCGIYANCQGSNILERDNDSELIKYGRRVKEIYHEKIVNSSTLRFGRAAVAIVSVFVDYKYSLSGVDTDTDEYKKRKSECHLRSAIRFRNLCSSNGGVFMKIGQHIGSLDFLFPREYTETLKCFQYNAPESPIEDIISVIESETSCSMRELFSSFDEKPIGSASLAQVHTATLKNGDEVAVKVQHKTVKVHAFQDEKVIEFFVNMASKLFPEFQFQWLVDQIKANLPLELDFLNEAKNCEKMGSYLTRFKNISVPKIFWEPSTSRVLFMEYIDGGAVDDLEYITKNKLKVNQISTELGHLYSEMIFVRGNIHCDPHAGNILVRKSKKNNDVEVILLDHGLYVDMDDTVRLNYCRLWQSMIEKNIDGIKHYSECLGVGQYYGLFACMVAGRSWESIQTGITEKKLTADELTEIQTGALDFVSQITDVFEKMPRELVMVFKTNDLLRGLDARLKTSAASASFICMSKSCLRAVYEAEYVQCETMVSKWKLYSKFKWNEFRLLVYQMSLSLPSINVFSSPTVLVTGIGDFLLGNVISLLSAINNFPKYISPTAAE